MKIWKCSKFTIVVKVHEAVELTQVKIIFISVDHAQIGGNNRKSQSKYELCGSLYYYNRTLCFKIEWLIKLLVTL